MKNRVTSKLQITENHRKSDVDESSKVAYGFIRNELYEGNVNVSKSKLNVQSVKSTTRSNMLKYNCKTKNLKFVFGSFVLHLPFNKLLLVVLFTKINRY